MTSHQTCTRISDEAARTQTETIIDRGKLYLPRDTRYISRAVFASIDDSWSSFVQVRFVSQDSSRETRD